MPRIDDDGKVFRPDDDGSKVSLPGKKRTSGPASDGRIDGDHYDEGGTIQTPVSARLIGGPGAFFLSSTRELDLGDQGA